MKLGEILTKAGEVAVKSFIPGGGMLLDIVNGFLPKDKQLPNEATGKEIIQAVNTLPPDQRAQIYLREIDVELAEISTWAQVQESLSRADQAGSSTRPQIALMMAKVVVFVVLTFTSIWAVAIFQNRTEMVKMLADCWPLMLTLVATPTALLRSYFGMRTKEKNERYHMAAGQASSPNFLENIVKMIRR